MTEVSSARDFDEEHSEDPLWYKDAIIYQIHVKAFHDANGDGIGDFAGLAQRLDYIQELGVNTLWLLPFYPSPMRDDGYDIADYLGINPAYGTLGDFQTFDGIPARRTVKPETVIDAQIGYDFQPESALGGLSLLRGFAWTAHHRGDHQ